MRILTRGSTNDIWVEEYEDRGAAVVNATVTGTVYAQDGTPVTGAIDIPMPYTAATATFPARYLGILPHTVPLPDPSYDLIVTATNPGGVRQFNETCIVEDG